MKIATVMGAISLSLPLLSDGLAHAVEHPALLQRLTVSEWGLRQAANFAPMPEYPRESLRAKVVGVVVAAVAFGSDGRLKSLEILESPDALTGTAVRNAVSRWTVLSPHGADRGANYVLEGKLTFYFRLQNGEGQVVDPDQMPGGTPRPQARPAVTTSPSGVPSLTVPPPTPTPRRGTHGETLQTITVGDFKQQLATTEHVVLDPGQREAFQRSHWPGAVNIPFDELAVRGGPELPREKLVVVDCTREELQLCRWAGGRLVAQNFPRLVLLVR